MHHWKSKQRLTPFLGANMNGNEKLKPLVIDKSKRPSCFKNIKSLPVEYEANSYAWITTSIWERHTCKLDSQASRQRRKAALIVNYCTAHSQPESLKAIEIVFLPPNVTALLQPLDQGIIRGFKRKFKKMLVKDLIKALDKNETFEVSVLEAINYVLRGWSSVSSLTVFNCFSHSGFVANAESEDILCEEVDPQPLGNLLLMKKDCSVYDVNAFVDIGNDIAICSQATVKDITSEFLDEKQHSSSEDRIEDDENSGGIPPSKAETLEASEKVRQYLTSIEGITEEEFKVLIILEKKVNSKQFLHQSTMLSYFNAQK